MINNSDTPGHFQVWIIARQNMVAAFQCPTLQDVQEEVARITYERPKKGLPVGRVTVKEILANRADVSPRLQFGPPLQIINS